MTLQEAADNVGSGVAYHHGSGRTEQGVITGVNSDEQRSKATPAENLSLAGVGW